MKSIKGKDVSCLIFTFHTKTDAFEIEMEHETGDWFLSLFESISPQNETLLSVDQLRTSYESHFGDFELFWHSKSIRALRENGLLVV